MKKNLTVQIFAFLALFWIIISIVWVWILFFMEWTSSGVQEQVLTPEELQKMIDEGNLQITESWALVWTWETQK